jgi:hypothetical protein
MGTYREAEEEEEEEQEVEEGEGPESGEEDGEEVMIVEDYQGKRDGSGPKTSEKLVSSVGQGPGAPRPFPPPSPPSQAEMRKVAPSHQRQARFIRQLAKASQEEAEEEEGEGGRQEKGEKTGGPIRGTLAALLPETEGGSARARAGKGRAAASASKGKAGAGSTRLTPLEQQVVALKRAHPDTLLLVECGYRVRFFGEDALHASQVLGIYTYIDHAFYVASIPTLRIKVGICSSFSFF